MNRIQKSFSLAGLVLVAFTGFACSKQTVFQRAEGALGPYSGAVLTGDYIYVSGKIGSASSRESTFDEEVNSAIDAVRDELGRAGATLSDVVSTTVFITDLDEYKLFNSIYAERFTTPYPARACVEVSELPGGARVEIQVIARH